MATKYETTVRKYGPKFKKDLDLTNVHVAGIFGNFAVETGKFKKMQEIKPLVPGSRGGYGWAQWTGPRRRAYEAWCKTNGQPVNSEDAMYKYVVYELTEGDEKKSLTQLRKTKTTDAAAETFMILYERPGIPHLDKRKQYAKEAFDFLVDEVKTPTTPEDKKVIINATNTSKGAEASTASIAVAGGVTYWIMNPTTHGLLIVGVTALAALVGWYAVSWYKDRQAKKVTVSNV